MINKFNRFLEKNFDQQITICANDAGAANHLLGIFKNNPNNTKLCLDGPALEIFKDNFKKFKNYKIEESLIDSKFLISGTGWSSDLEHNSRKIAHERGIFNIAIIDHWVNYFERFCRGKEVILPDEIWVTDCEAFKIANQVFPETPILKIPNIWLDNIKIKVNNLKNLERDESSSLPSKLLFLTEPIRSNWGKLEKGEFQSMRYFFSNLKRLSSMNLICPFDEIREVKVKLHPSEEFSKYDNLIKNFENIIPVKKTIEKDLAEVLVYTDACFGCETQALVVSMNCGLPTFSSMPPWAPKCRLPHENIIHLRNIL